MDPLAPYPSAPDYAALVELVTTSVASPHTARAYARALRDYLAWYEAAGRPPFNKMAVQRHIADLRERGVSASSINQRLSALRRLAQEAADNGFIDEATAAAIGRAKGIKRQGERLGRWLSQAEAQRLLNAPGTATLKGLRDRAILALLLGAGLRREELVRLTPAHLQRREERWLLVNIEGKGGKTRSIPLASWTKQAVDEWRRAAGIPDGDGPLFLTMDRHGYTGEAVGVQAVRGVVRLYAAEVGLGELAPHDLRRTYARLAYRGGASLEQLRATLGHASIATTQRYLGAFLDLDNAPADYLGLG